MEGTTEYANFRAWVPRKILPVGTLSPQDWVYYDWGPRGFDEPLLCLHAVLGSAESFHLQTLELAKRGYRVISPQLPVYWSAAEFCDGLHTFLDMLNVRRVHLYGAGLGGFLALQFSARRPERVVSVALTHTFLSTASVDHGIVYSPSILRWLPDFLVRGAVRGLCPSGPAPIHIAEAAEFVIRKTMAASREELASRLALLVTEATVVGRLRLSEERITWIDAAEHAASSATGTSTTDEAKNVLPNARRALLKAGGEFPYLGSAEEVSMHLVVHLRRNAAPPAEPLPLPPPARARATPSRRRRERTSSVSSEKDDDSTGESAAEMKARAEQIVTAAEAAHAEQYGSEVAKLRQYLPDRDDKFILSILVDCDGDADSTVAKARDGQYSKRFYEKTRRRALRSAVRDIRKANREAEKAKENDGSKDGKGTPGASISVPHEDANAASATVEAIGFGVGEKEPVARSHEEDVVDPLNPQAVSDSRRSSSASLTLHGMPVGGTLTRSSPVLGESMEVISSAALETGMGMTSAGTPSRRASEGGEHAKESSRSKNARWKSLDRRPSDADSITAYVTSERVGMRSDTLISRGPTPLTKSTSSRGSLTNAQLSLKASAASDFPHAAATSSDFYGTAPPQGSIQPLAIRSTSQSAPGLGMTREASAASEDTMAKKVPAPPPVVEDDDGWGEFRRMGLLSMEDDSSPTNAAPTDAEGSREQPALKDDASDEASRLRDWVMSARTATESAQRRGT